MGGGIGPHELVGPWIGYRVLKKNLILNGKTHIITFNKSVDAENKNVYRFIQKNLSLI